jgi:hypothetical protein
MYLELHIGIVYNQKTTFFLGLERPIVVHWGIWTISTPTLYVNYHLQQEGSTASD